MNIHLWLIPSKANKFHPHALRPLGLIVFLLLFISIPLAYNVTTARTLQVLGYATNVSINDVYALTNQERANNGLPPLQMDSQLNSAAQAKANHMMANNYWAHVAPDGTTPWYFITNAGYQYSVAGENLAKNFNTSSGVVAGWMGSAGHRANILSTGYADIGLATVNGVLQGTETTLVVAMYATRTAPAPAPTPAPGPAAPTTPTPPAVTPTPTPSTPSETTPTEPTQAPSPTQPTDTESNDESTPIVENTSAPSTSTIAPETGTVEGLSTFLPVKVYTAMNWGQKTSLLLLSALFLLFIMKHTLIWREQKRGVRNIWLRAHPVGQMIVLIVGGVVTVLAGIGVVL